MSKEFKDAMHALRMSGTVMTTAGEDVLRELLARSAPESAEEGPQCVKCGDTGQRRVLDTSQGPDGEYYDVDCECLNAPPVAEPAKCAAKIHPERFIREAADKAAVWSSDCRNIRVLPMSALDTILITLDAMQNHSKPYEDSPDCAQNPAQTGCPHSTPVEGCEWCDVATAAFPELAQSPAKDEAGEVVACHDCGFPYGSPGWIETVIPHAIWKEISPSKDEGGILCVYCMSKRLAANGRSGVPIPADQSGSPAAVASVQDEVARAVASIETPPDVKGRVMSEMFWRGVYALNDALRNGDKG